MNPAARPDEVFMHNYNHLLCNLGHDYAIPFKRFEEIYLRDFVAAASQGIFVYHHRQL